MRHAIRLARVDDFTAVQALNGELFVFEKVFSSEYNLDWMYEERGIAYFIRRILDEDGKSILLVAEMDRVGVVGYICGYLDSYSARNTRQIAEVENMFVLEEFRQKRIGRDLMEAFMKEAKMRGAGKCKVALLTANRNAEAFYRQMGYHDHELVLERTLS